MELETENNNDLNVPTRERTVLEKIFDWSKSRPMWQRDALRRILQKNDIDDQDIKELVICLKNEKSEKPNNTAIPLTEANLPANPDAVEAIRISKISNILHVNNLAKDQTLTFQDKGITVIYGGNGSGKSGYTRILKNACRARHRDKEILSNIHAPEYKLEKPTANIYYNTNSKTDDLVNWEASDSPHEVLSAVYVFDRQCADVHIKKQGNEIAFSPYGLDIPDRLVGVCNRVEEYIKIEISGLMKARNKILSNPPWQSTTIVGAFATNITKDSKIEDLERLSDFTKIDEDRLVFLTETLSKNIHKAAQEEEFKAGRLLRFKNDINAITQKISKEKLAAILTQKQVFINTKRAAESAARNVMGEDILSGVGEEIWKIMWNAAKKYSLENAYTEKSFPNIEDGAKCVLCQQVLDTPAKERMKSFEEHIKGNLEQQAEKEENSYSSLRKESIFVPIRRAHQQDSLNDIGLIDANMLRVVRRYLASIRLRQIQFRLVVNKSKDINISDYSPSPFDEINQQIEKHQASAEELRKSANDAGIAVLKKEKVELEDKRYIKEHKQSILDEIKRLQEIFLLEECVKSTSTRSVTTLSNKITDEVITPKIENCFQKEIRDLMGERVRVDFQRKGGKPGSPNHKLVLLSSPETVLSTVLSEGEQTCVAMAIFLAELATAPHKSALVFDDPVSSLDHKWRSIIADRLVEEAKTRQVIVFTHDLVFINDIQGSSANSGVEFSSRHLSRTPKIVGIVNDSLPWDGMGIKARIDDLGKRARELGREHNNLTQEEYDFRASEFFNHMRASWERALEEVGLSHVVMRYRDYINTNHINNISALNLEACQDWRRDWSHCCNYISGHDPSSARNRPLPEPDELVQEVVKLQNWVNKIKENRKTINPNP